jgi:hypothetical protein
MKWLTLSKIKAQLRIDPDFNDEDEWLEDAGEAAEDAILEALNRDYEDLYEVYGRIPAPVRQTSLMLVDSLYQFRGKDATQTLQSNPTFALLLKPYMRLSSNKTNNTQYGCKNL